MMNEKLIFTCSSNDQDVFRKFIHNISISEIEKDLNSNIEIDGIEYQPCYLSDEINIIIRLIQNHWCNIQTIALHDDLVPYDEIISSREFTNDMMNLIKLALNVCTNTDQKVRYLEDMFESIQCIPKFIVPFDELQLDMLLKVAALNTNNKKCPIYQYFHTNLELQYNLLILYYFCEKQSLLDELVEKIMKNLVAISRKHFKRHENNVGIFICPCVKHFFMVLQYIKGKTSLTENSFWKLFNGILDNDDPVFSLSLLKELAAAELLVKKNAQLDISPNFEFLEAKLKIFLINPETYTILQVFKITDSLINKIWLEKSKIEALQIIWDYYSKRLNVSNKNYSKLSSLDVNRTLDTVISNRENCKEDFELFVAILIEYLRNHPEHWTKMKGRIYSQLGNNKLKDLNETGIAHVGILFISLSTIFYEEMQKRVLSLFDVFMKEKKEMMPIVWNIYMAFIFQDLKDSKSLEKTATGMKTMLQNASLESKFFYFIKNFLTDFKHCLNLNQNLTLHQWVFFDSWLDKYLSTCSIPDLRLSLEIFTLILQTLKETDKWSLWKTVFKDHIYPPLKKIAISFTAPEEIGEIAGLISNLDLELSGSIFSVFTTDVSPNVSCRFLLVVLDDYSNKFVLSERQKSLFVQSWIKISLLTGESTADLTKKFLRLDIFPSSLKSYIENATNPLYALLEYLGSDIKSHLQSSHIYKICESSFGHIDTWLTQYLHHIENDVVVYRIFTFISLAFLHCGRLLYNRNKISTPLTKLVEVVLLPQDVLFGKAPHQSVLNALKKTWHVFFEALINLNDDSDRYLERTLRDMVVKYVPFFNVTDSPFLKCLEKEKVSTVLFEKIANSYFRHPVKESDENVLKMLKMLKDIISSTTSVSVLKIVVDTTLFSIFEFIILHPQRNAAFVLVKTLISSQLYPQVSKEFCNTIMAVTEKHMAHNTINYFQLLCILAKFVPADMKSLLGSIKQQVVNVERLRGVGFDNNLRMHYEKFESTINESLS